MMRLCVCKPCLLDDAAAAADDDDDDDDVDRMRMMMRTVMMRHDEDDSARHAYFCTTCGFRRPASPSQRRCQEVKPPGNAVSLRLPHETSLPNMPSGHNLKTGRNCMVLYKRLYFLVLARHIGF